MRNIRKRLGKNGDTIELSSSLRNYTPEQREHFEAKLNAGISLVESGRSTKATYGRALADKILMDRDPKFKQRRMTLALIHGIGSDHPHRSVIPITEHPPVAPQTPVFFLSISRMQSLQNVTNASRPFSSSHWQSGPTRKQ